jgi:hypothetical protein
LQLNLAPVYSTPLKKKSHTEKGCGAAGTCPVRSCGTT